MPFYQRGSTRIYYEEVGSGFPLLIIPGGGLNSTVSSLQTSSPFNPMETYKNDFRCISADLRNANGGQSSGLLEIDRPWDAYSDDQLGLMDHLGIQKFGLLGFCIAGPMMHNKRWLITLSGELEIGLGDGSVHKFGPGDVRLIEDVTGHGHTTRYVTDHVSALMLLPD